VELAFRSKRDGWLVAVLWFASALLLAGAISVAVSGSPFGIALAVFMVASGALGPWALYATAYTITPTELLVRSGPFRWRIALDAIETVVPTRLPLSSPACSLDRLRIAYRGANGRPRALLISPEHTPVFLASLAARCPQLANAGDRLVAR